MGKLYTYYENDFIIRDSYSRKYKDIGNNSEYELLNTLKDENKVLAMSDTHKSNDLSSICYAILEELSKTPNYPVKKCQNCGMYFIPKAKTDEIYCEYPKEDSKPCRDLGAFQSYTQRLKDNQALFKMKNIFYSIYYFYEYRFFIRYHCLFFYSIMTNIFCFLYTIFENIIWIILFSKLLLIFVFIFP